MSDAFKPLLAKLADGQTLGDEDAEVFFAACLRGEPTPAQVAAAVTAMRLRGETVGEIAACARAMRRAAVHLDHPYEVIDVCGTGGDGLHTLNISTAVGFVAAGGGLKVAKHGNRAITSKSGTADVLTALGVNIDATRAQQRRALDEAGICFLFAQNYHPALKRLGPIRRAIGERTIFNLMGPLANPANVRRQLVGIARPAYVPIYAQALAELGVDRAMIVSGDEGLDELSLDGGNDMAEVKGNALVAMHRLHGSDLDLPSRPVSAIRGGDAAHNAAALRALLQGEQGAYRDAVLLNAAVALVVADAAADLREGMEEAAETIDRGLANALLNCWIAYS